MDFVPLLPTRVFPTRSHLIGSEHYLKPDEREALRKELLAEYMRRNGQLRRYEMWYGNYYAQSYLKGATKAEFVQRWYDIWDNKMRITEDNKIGLSDFRKDDKWFRRFAECLAESQFRGGAPALAGADLIIRKFGEKVEKPVVHPPKSVTSLQHIFKFGKRKYLEDIIQKGSLRLTNSAQYNQNAMNNAQRDDESAMSFFLSSELVREFDGLTGLADLDPSIPSQQFELRHSSRENYLMWCGALGYDRRMPYAFDADSVLVISNTVKFKKLVLKAIKSEGLFPLIAKVRYFDPYLDLQKSLDLRFSKHFRFEYQKEYRVVASGKELPSVFNLSVPELPSLCQIYDLY